MILRLLKILMRWFRHHIWPVLQQCRTELLMHVARLKSIAAELVDLEFPISEGTNIYEEAVQNLANNIANGFTYRTKQHKQKTTFNCSVSFASAKNSIRPSQRVFGKAQGRAKLEVEFESERMGWNGGKNLRGNPRTQQDRNAICQRQCALFGSCCGAGSSKQCQERMSVVHSHRT